MIDLAIVGAGAAGTWLAAKMLEARPEWSITLLERSDRIGGRLRSVAIPGLAHPIELGGMRYLTSHLLVDAVVAEEGIPTRPFDPIGAPERSFLRGRFGSGAADAGALDGYDLADDERGRSPIELLVDAFDRIVPGAASIASDAWPEVRAGAAYRGRLVRDWSLEEAARTVRSGEGWTAVTDAFGYDSGINPHNAADAIPYLLGAGNPAGEARVPIDGMDRITRALADRFVGRGGTVRRSAEVIRLEAGAGKGSLVLADGEVVRARQVALALPIPALQRLAATSPALDAPVHRRLFASVQGFRAMKLYVWFDRPWWRGAGGVPGLRSTTDLPLRKVFYFDERADAPAAILASYTDGRLATPWVTLAGAASNGEPAPPPMLAAVIDQLRRLHPDASIPKPLGSALMHWGADPTEVGWHYWRSGYNTDESIAAAVQPEPGVPIHLCGEVFSRNQAWVEGALESAALVRERLLQGSGSPP